MSTRVGNKEAKTIQNRPEYLVKGLAFLIAFFIVLLDQISKSIVTKFAATLPINIIPKIFQISLVHNTGGAFGVLKDSRLFFITVSVIVSIAIISILLKSKEKGFVLVSLGIILGGAVGNLLDRIKLGYVIDFLDFQVWPVFNLADSAINIGMFMILISLFFKRK